MPSAGLLDRIRSARARLAADGPPRVLRPELAFTRVSLPSRDADLVRDLLIAEGARTVVEVGLAYAVSALAIAEALAHADGTRHIVIDPFQHDSYDSAGWELLTAAVTPSPSNDRADDDGDSGEGGSDGGGDGGDDGGGGGGGESRVELVTDWSSVALPRLLSAGVIADAAFVDGSHRYHEVFLDLYYLRKIVRPGGLIILDDDCVPSVRAAVRYFETNLGWRPLPGAFASGTHIGSRPRCVAMRLPDPSFEPPFGEFRPFWS